MCLQTYIWVSRTVNNAALVQMRHSTSSAQMYVTSGSTQLQTPCRPYVMQSALCCFAGLALKLAFFPDDVSNSSKDMGKQSKDDSLL